LIQSASFLGRLSSATILGIVDAGVGPQLSDRIRINNWYEAAFIIPMILAVIDNLPRHSHQADRGQV
jgi:phosphonate transport system permease protein